MRIKTSTSFEPSFGWKCKEIHPSKCWSEMSLSNYVQINDDCEQVMTSYLETAPANTLLCWFCHYHFCAGNDIKKLFVLVVFFGPKASTVSAPDSEAGKSYYLFQLGFVDKTSTGKIVIAKLVSLAMTSFFSSFLSRITVAQRRAVLVLHNYSTVSINCLVVAAAVG